MAVKYKNDLSKTQMCNMYYRMYNRCLTRLAYKDCKICSEWLNNKENFYKWVSQNYYTIDNEQIDLDKDILIKGNKIYSPDTCVFVPHHLNICFSSNLKEPIYLKKLNKYKIGIWTGTRDITIGYFDNKEEAIKEYIRHKEAFILTKADKYKDKIPDTLYNAMIKYKFEISDFNK